MPEHWLHQILPHSITLSTGLPTSSVTVAVRPSQSASGTYVTDVTDVTVDVATYHIKADTPRFHPGHRSSRGARGEA